MLGNFLVIWINFSVKIDGSYWLFGISILIAILFSYFIYRHTIPPVNRFLKAVLFILRSLALFILIALLFHPILSLQDTYIQKPDIAVLLDNSRSLQIMDSNVKRTAVVRDILENKVWQQWQDRYQFHFFPFSNQIDTTLSEHRMDSLQFNGKGTNIAGALEMSQKRLMDQFYSAAILISDGIYNMGENPEFLSQRYNVPIYTIGVGDPTEKKDVILSRHITNDVVYANNQVPVDVTLKQVGFADKRVQVILKQGEKVVEQKRIPLAKDGQEQHVTLNYKAKQPGFQKFQIEVPALDGEFTRRNNTRNFVAKVLESKIKILLLAGQPSPDFKFIRRAMESDKNIEVTPLVQKKSGGFYLKDQLQTILREEYHLFIFLGFPRWRISPSFNQYLTEQLIGRKKSFFFIQGRNIDISSLRSFQSVLPFAINTNPRSPRKVAVGPTISGEESPIVMLRDSRDENRALWNNLPPVVTYLTNFAPYGDCNVLLQVKPGQSKLPDSENYRKPVLISRNLGEQKALAFLGYGLWHWDLMMWGVGRSNDTFLTFLQRSVRWLTTREEMKRVRVNTDQMVYHSGEQVYIQAQVYTEDYRQVDDASVQLQVIHQDKKNIHHLEPIGAGKYQTQFRVFRGGNYEYRAEAKKGDRFFGADTGRFSVGEYDIEFQQTRMNASLLQRVAKLSGGKFYNPDNFETISDHLPDVSREKVRVTEINLWNEWLVLVVFLVLLCVEWTIRRRRGML